MEQPAIELEQRQHEVDSLMTWLGWNMAPRAADLRYDGDIDFQGPMRDVRNISEEVESAKVSVKENDKDEVRLFFPSIKTTNDNIQGLNSVKTPRPRVRVKGQKFHLFFSTRELFHEIADILVRQFGFVIPERIESDDLYPTNDPQVFVDLGDTSNRFKGKPLEDVSLLVRDNA